MIKIKKYENKYSDQVEKLHIQIFKEIGQRSKDWKEMQSQNIPCLVAINDKDVVVGYAIYQQYDSSLYFNWLGVLPKFRSKGVGYKLLNEVIKEAKKLKVNFIEVRSRNRFTAALCLYMKNGFKIEGTYLHSDGEMMIVLRKKMTTQN